MQEQKAEYCKIFDEICKLVVVKFEGFKKLETLVIIFRLEGIDVLQGKNI